MGGEMLFDRIPPQNLEAEQAVLGAILLQGEALITAMERVQTEDFYDKPHQLIFEAMIQLGEGNQPIDLVTLTSLLKDKGELEDIGGVSYLAKLAHGVPTAANVDYYAQIIEEKSIFASPDSYGNTDRERRIYRRRRCCGHARRSGASHSGDLQPSLQ